MTSRAPSLEEQLRRSIHQVQQTKRATAGDVTAWIEDIPEPVPVPPKRLRRKKMSEAIVRHEQPTELTAWRAMREQADELVKSGFLPKAIRTAEQAIAIMQTGKELGLGPMQSLRGIHVIDGKPAMSADLIAGLALSRVPGSTLRVAESTNTVCRVEAARAGHAATTFSFSIDDAKAAGLVGKDVWRRYPRAMLRARCLTEACRAVFPDVVMGLYSPEELEDSTPGQLGQPMRMERDGEVIEVQPFRDGSDITPHADSPDAAPAMVHRGEYEAAMYTLEAMDREVFDPGCTWASMSAIRGKLGSKGKPTEFSQKLSDMYRGDLSPEERKKLSALWNRVDRKLTALESKLKPPPVEASFTDEPDGTEAFAPEREPGADEDEDLL